VNWLSETRAAEGEVHMLDDAALAAHPQASAADLARIVTQRPDLRPVVAANPAAHPGLLDWLAALREPAVDAALARRSASATPPTVRPGAVFHPDGAPPRTTPGGVPAAVGVAVDEQVGTPEAPGRSRRGGWIAVGVAVALVVGLGAGAAWLLVLSKLGGSSTPEAAVTQLVEGAAAKDGVAVYGAISPAEVSTFTDLVEPFSELSGVTGQEVSAQKLLGVLDTLDVDLSGLRVHSESIGDGLAKVTIVGGSLTVDGDGAAIVAALADVYGPLATAGLSAEDVDAGWAEATQEIEAKLPWTITADDLVVHSERGDIEPFLVAVREGDAWYVSPLMTMGEYATAERGATRRAMPTGPGTFVGTPEDAGEAFVRSFTEAASGDLGPLADLLPPAERRFVAVYGQAWTDQEEPDALDVPTIEEARFTSTAIDGDGDRVRLVAAPVVVTTPATDRGPVRTTIEGTCVTQDDGPRECFADQPLVRQLGLDDAGLVAVRDDDGWRVSILATTADVSRLVAQHVRELKASGDLDDGEFLQKLWMDAFSEQLEGVDDTAPGDADSVWPLPETDDGDALGSDPLEPDPWAGSGYSFDSDGVLHGPDGEVVKNWSMRNDGSLLDEDGTVLAGP